MSSPFSIFRSQFDAAVDGGEDVGDGDGEDAAWFAEFAADVARARLARELFENDLARGLRPRPPVHAVRRTEDHDARRPDGGRDVRDAGIVPDKNIGTTCKRGQFGQAEVGERRDLAFCRTPHRRERRGLVRSGNGRHTKAF